MSLYDDLPFSSLLGKTLTNVRYIYDNYDDRIYFTVNEDEEYMLYHIQDCCENVRVEDIAGDLQDLIGSPITLAEEVTGETPADSGTSLEYCDSYTWTFYKLSTIKGSVTIRWLGTSNGYYSESVSFRKVY